MQLKGIIKMSFLPICKEDLERQGIEQLDFIYVSGDAYVDHPSFGHAIITRLVESQGFTIGIIAQPQTDSDYLKLGTPKFAFLVGSGVVDSMVNNYSVAKKKRKLDVYSEGGIAGKRPDRALTVYCKNLRKLFGDTPIIIGGIEASLRRFAHYDYWNDSVMPSILLDTDADLLMYGMGEVAMINILDYAKRNIPLKHLTNHVKQRLVQRPLLRQPTDGYHVQRLARQLFLQSRPHPCSLLRVRHHPVRLVGK